MAEPIYKFLPSHSWTLGISCLIFLRKRRLGSCFLVEVNGLAAALEALW